APGDAGKSEESWRARALVYPSGRSSRKQSIRGFPDPVTSHAKHEVPSSCQERFRRSDVLVEATAAGITRRRTSLDNALAVQTIEGYGQLQVRHATTGQPLPKVYVKVYAELQNGKVHFHKDGYTDLRGRFDYASLSNNNLRTIRRFAVLVLSETHGAQIHTLQPPR